MPARLIALMALLAALPAASRVYAQAPDTAQAAVPAGGAAACCIVPADTAVDLEILDALNSSRHKRGDAFRVRLTGAVVVDGKTLIPSGTEGVGEIVHAAAARGGGAPGELLIAARWLDVEGQQVRLRGLKLGMTGGDNSGMALAVSFGAGPFAMFIRGREIEIPAGTRVHARLANDTTLVAAADQPVDSTIFVSPTVAPVQE